MDKAQRQVRLRLRLLALRSAPCGNATGLPLAGASRLFEWGVWVSLSRENFIHSGHLWNTAGRESAEPMFGWLSTALPTYHPATLSLKTMVHTREVGLRPLVVLEPTDHPLAVEQRDGITVDVLEKRASQLLHPA